MPPSIGLAINVFLVLGAQCLPIWDLPTAFWASASEHSALYIELHVVCGHRWETTKGHLQ